MKFPFLISVPHGGTRLVTEFLNYFRTSNYDLMLYHERSCIDIFSVMKDEVEYYIDTPISKLVADVNKPPNQFSDPNNLLLTRCGIHVPDSIHDTLLKRYYHPYHNQIQYNLSDKIKVALDCHTTISIPRGRPMNRSQKDGVVISIKSDNRRNSNRLAYALQMSLLAHFDCSVNLQFQLEKAYISKLHYQLPWIQLEIALPHYCNIEDIKLKLYQSFRDLSIILTNTKSLAA